MNPPARGDRTPGTRRSGSRPRNRPPGRLRAGPSAQSVIAVICLIVAGVILAIVGRTDAVASAHHARTSASSAGSPSPSSSPTPTPSSSPTPKPSRSAHPSHHSTGPSQARGSTPGPFVVGNQNGLLPPLLPGGLTVKHFQIRPGSNLNGLFPIVAPSPSPLPSVGNWPGARPGGNHLTTGQQLVANSLSENAQAANSQAGLVSLAAAFAATGFMLVVGRARKKRQKRQEP